MRAKSWGFNRPLISRVCTCSRGALPDHRLESQYRSNPYRERLHVTAEFLGTLSASPARTCAGSILSRLLSASQNRPWGETFNRGGAEETLGTSPAPEQSWQSSLVRRYCDMFAPTCGPVAFLMALHHDGNVASSENALVPAARGGSRGADGLGIILRTEHSDSPIALGGISIASRASHLQQLRLLFWRLWRNGVRLGVP